MNNKTWTGYFVRKFIANNASPFAPAERRRRIGLEPRGANIFAALKCAKKKAKKCAAQCEGPKVNQPDTGSDLLLFFVFGVWLRSYHENPFFGGLQSLKCRGNRCRRSSASLSRSYLISSYVSYRVSLAGSFGFWWYVHVLGRCAVLPTLMDTVGPQSCQLSAVRMSSKSWYIFVECAGSLQEM